jgi:hypothetical protein
MSQLWTLYISDAIGFMWFLCCIHPWYLFWFLVYPKHTDSLDASGAAPATQMAKVSQDTALRLERPSQNPFGTQLGPTPIASQILDDNALQSALEGKVTPTFQHSQRAGSVEAAPSPSATNQTVCTVVGSPERILINWEWVTGRIGKKSGAVKASDHYRKSEFFLGKYPSSFKLVIGTYYEARCS